MKKILFIIIISYSNNLFAEECYKYLDITQSIKGKTNVKRDVSLSYIGSSVYCGDRIKKGISYGLRYTNIDYRGSNFLGIDARFSPLSYIIDLDQNFYIKGELGFSFRLGSENGTLSQSQEFINGDLVFGIGYNLKDNLKIGLNYDRSLGSYIEKEGIKITRENLLIGFSFNLD